MRIWTSEEISPNEFRAQVSLSDDEAFELIKVIDLDMADLDFTKRVLEYFTEEVRKEESD